MKNLPLELSHFTNLRDTTPTRHQATTWAELVHLFADSVELDNKNDGTLWSPTRFRLGSARSNQGADTVSCFVLDLDETPWEKVKPFLEPFEYFAHTTHSHSVERESWRVILPLTRPVPASQWEATWSRLHRLFGKLGDNACRDASRFYFHPAHKPGNDHDEVHHEGQLLSPDCDALTATPTTRLNSVSAVLNEWDNEKQRNRHDTALRCVLAVEGLRHNGANVDEAFQRIQREFIALILDRCTPNEALAEWNRIVEGARGKVADDSPTSGTTTDDTTPQATKRREPSVADKLVKLGLARYRFTVADNGQTLAVPLTGSPIAKSLHGDTKFRDELSSLYHDDCGRVPNSNALRDAVATLSGRAQRNPSEVVHYRRADLGNSIVIDLGDTTGNVVEITANGWEILPHSPVVFRRSASLGTLARPTTPTSDTFRQLVPADDTSFRMVVAWLVASHFDRPLPILFPEAEQGAGKTTLVRWLKRLTDPSLAEVNALPRDEKHWRTVATNSHVVVLDNVSRIEPWLSDLLCRAVTGDGVQERTLYSDNSPSVYAFRRAIVLTSIHLASLRGDLTERLLSVTLQRIPDNKRRPERELEALFREHVGETLAWLYRLTAGVLAELHNVKLDESPRMADFAEILVALDRVTGWNTFRTYQDTTRNIVASLVLNDEVGRTVLNLAETQKQSTTYTTQELLEALRTQNDFLSPDAPRNPQQLGTRLAYLIEPLRQAGVLVERPTRSAKERRWRITRKSDDCDGCDGLSLFPSVRTSQEVREAEGANT